MAQQFSQNPYNQFEPERLPIGWPWRLFVSSLVIFSLSLVSFAGLKYAYQPYLHSQIDQQEAELRALGIPESDRQTLAQAYSVLVNIGNLLDNHVLASKAPALLERVTHARAYYDAATVRVPQREIELTGVTASYETLVQQLTSYESADEIEGVVADQARLSADAVSFGAILRLREGFLKVEPR